ncbi:MAG: pyridoxal-phosphate dependent enzyme [candidate division NC10 bacterium]|nr:pyridoxal-phosphate dependent enzyme [candidate division NC10 bacterium]
MNRLVHRQQGIGEGFILEVLRQDLIDEVIVVGDDEAVALARRLAREAGILGGFSSGANVAAAERVPARLTRLQAVVTLIPDSGLCYHSSELYEEANHS